MHAFYFSYFLMKILICAFGYYYCFGLEVYGRVVPVPLPHLSA
jgi:hypothetical protein